MSVRPRGDRGQLLTHRGRDSVKTQHGNILGLPHPKSKHEPMPMSDRTAQFSSFAALTSYGDAIDETARLTDKRIELSKEEHTELDYKQQYIATLDSPTVTATYFVHDAARKSGGAYVTHTRTLNALTRSSALWRSRTGRTWSWIMSWG